MLQIYVVLSWFHIYCIWQMKLKGLGGENSVWPCDQGKTIASYYIQIKVKTFFIIYLIKCTKESHLMTPGTCIKKANRANSDS